MINRFKSCFILTLLFFTPSLFAGSVWLSSLDLSRMTTGWSVAKANREIADGPLSIHGQKFDFGVGTHATSKFRVKLDGRAERFAANVGVDDSAGNQGSVEFIVIGDGKILWRSGVLKGGDPAMPVSVSLKDVNILTLRVTDGRDGESNAHADWANAKIIMKDGSAPPSALPPYDTFGLKTKNFTVNFQVGDDGRLYQFPIGSAENSKLLRDQEFYPQAGDGYVWEPALEVIHADGNTSTVLLYDGMMQTNESPNIEVTRIHLHDPAYPFEVTLCFRTHYHEDVVEQWTEIRHHESGVVTLQRMTSSSLLFATNVYLTHFFGDWAKEMMYPITEQITPGVKVLDSKLGVRADQYQNPSFILSLNARATETNGEVLAGSLAWSGSFQCTFDDNVEQIRALCGINPFATAYHLKPDETFTTPTMIWVWSDHGFGDMSRKFHDWARDFGIRNGHQTRDVLLNNWEATGFDFDFNRIVSLFGPAKDLGV